jgi:isoleucyl-tRNA synthetase
VTELYEKFDLKGVYEATKEFLVRDVLDFYLDYSKYRRRRLMYATTNQDSALEVKDTSTLTGMYHTLQTILLSMAPILPFSA